MPNRILKESITTSDTLARLSATEERLYIRLIVAADDDGRIDGRPTVIRATCFPRTVNGIRDADITAQVDALVREGLAARVEVDGAPYLELLSSPEHWEPGPTPRAEWSRLRPTLAPLVMERDGYACVYCGAARDLQIDHVHPVSRGGHSTLDNLATACGPCNRSKRAMTLVEWRGRA